MSRLVALALLVLAGLAVAVLGSGAGAAPQTAPHLVLSGPLTGPCTQGPVVVTGTAASAELGQGTFQSTITVTAASNALVTYAETFRATFGNTVVNGSIPATSAQGTCGANGLSFSGTFRATINSPESGAGNSEIAVSQATYTHTFTPDPRPPAESTTTGSTTTAPSGHASVSAAVSARWLATKAYTRVVSLRVTARPTGTTVILSCTSKRLGCPFVKKTYTVGRSGTITLTSALRAAKLEPGAHLQLRITRAGLTGRVVDYTVRRLKTPAFALRCLPPGATKPIRC